MLAKRINYALNWRKTPSFFEVPLHENFPAWKSIFHTDAFGRLRIPLF